MSAGDTVAFLRALFDQAPPDLWTLFWTLQDKRSHWEGIGQGPESLAGKVAALVEGRDVYVSVSASQSTFGANRRISNAEAAGIMGLWADIDIADPDVHKKWNLPPTTEAAMEVLAASGLEPSLVVHSGHGLQAWWLFDEFWEFHTEEERLQAAQLAQGWNTTLRVRAAERGWTVDSTFDLARVMRIPGTMNRKGEPHVEVVLVADTGARYGRDHFEAHMTDESVLQMLGVSPSSSYVVGDDLTLNPEAEPPFRKFQALCDVEPTFQKSWDRTRSSRDLPDQSPSSYDLSLASLAAIAGWSDQEIVDLLIASRRRHGDDLKLRVDYYKRTVSKAHESLERVRAVEVMEEVSDQLEEARRSGDDDEMRAKRRGALNVVSQQFGIEVVKVIKFNSTPPSYRLVTPTGGISVGSAQEMLSQNTMRAVIAAETAHLIDRFKAADWDKLMRVIFRAAEEQDIGMESTEAGQIYVWLSEYLAARRPVDSKDEGAISLYPYTDEDGDTYIFSSSFKQWLWLNRGERVSHKDLGRMLRLFGCVPSNVSVTDDAGQMTTKAVWKIPPKDAWRK